MTHGTKLDRFDWSNIQHRTGAPTASTRGNYYLDDATGIQWTRASGSSWQSDIWIANNLTSNVDVIYPRNSNLTIATTNKNCFFATQAYVGQSGYLNSGSTMGNANKFLSIFSIESIVGDNNISCSLFGQTQTIGDSNVYLSVFGGDNTIGDSNIKVFVAGDDNTIDSGNISTAVLGQSNIIGNGNLVLSVFGQSNRIGNSTLLNAVFGGENYIESSTQYSVVSGRFAKATNSMCHVHAGGHPSLMSIPAEDMEDDCGAGQNIGMIPHTGTTTTTGWVSLSMNGASSSPQYYKVGEARAFIFVTYIVAVAGMGTRTKGWKIESLVRRGLGPEEGVNIQSTTVTVLGSTSEGGESTWDVRHRSGSTYDTFIIDVYGAAGMTVNWQAYSFSPEILSTEEYLT